MDLKPEHKCEVFYEAWYCPCLCGDNEVRCKECKQVKDKTK